MPGEGSRIRRIRADEWGRLRALRLAALADSPMAFGSTLAGEEMLPEREWQDRAAGGAAGESRVTYVAERDGALVGMATGLSEGDDPGLVAVVGVWVAPAARGQGVGEALVRSVVDWARERGSPQIELWVTRSNAAAVTLYRRLGFDPTGEEQPLPHTPGRMEIRMRLALEGLGRG